MRQLPDQRPTRKPNRLQHRLQDLGEARLEAFLKIFQSLLTPWAFLLVQLNIREASLLLCLSWYQTLLLHIWAEFSKQMTPLRE